MTFYVPIAAAALFAIGVSALFAVALGRAAAHEDALLEGEARRLSAQNPLTASIGLPRSSGPPPGERFQAGRPQAGRPQPARLQADRLARLQADRPQSVLWTGRPAKPR